jgi:hypothetical protein
MSSQLLKVKRRVNLVKEVVLGNKVVKAKLKTAH